jgi:hypothetical protein
MSAADEWIGMNQKVQAILDSFDAKLASLFFGTREAPCNIFDACESIPQRKRMSLCHEIDGGELFLHEIKCSAHKLT